MKYDVFLSYRGKDTRENFVSHIKIDLYREGIKAFNVTKMDRGKDITTTVLRAIRKSMVSVVIFSKNYVSSAWSLDELVKIMEFKRILKQKVIPIFYNVDPSNVENLTRSFGDDLAVLKKDSKYKENVHAWRSALKDASSLVELYSRNIRPDSRLVNQIVKDKLKIIEDELPNYPKGDLPLLLDPTISDAGPSMHRPPPPLINVSCYDGLLPPMVGLILEDDGDFSFSPPPPCIIVHTPPPTGLPFCSILPSPQPSLPPPFMFPYGPYI